MGNGPVGRPKQNWLHYAKKTAYELKMPRSDDTESVKHDFQVHIATLSRKFYSFPWFLGCANALLLLTILHCKVELGKTLLHPFNFPKGG